MHGETMRKQSKKSALLGHLRTSRDTVQKQSKKSALLGHLHMRRDTVWKQSKKSALLGFHKMVRRALFACGDVVQRSFSIFQAMLWVTINWKSATWSLWVPTWMRVEYAKAFREVGLSISFKSWSLYILHIVAGLLLSHNIKRSYVAWVLLSGVHTS